MGGIGKGSGSIGTGILITRTACAVLPLASIMSASHVQSCLVHTSCTVAFLSFLVQLVMYITSVYSLSLLSHSFCTNSLFISIITSCTYVIIILGGGCGAVQQQQQENIPSTHYFLLLLLRIIIARQSHDAAASPLHHETAAATTAAAVTASRCRPESAAASRVATAAGNSASSPHV